MRRIISLVFAVVILAGTILYVDGWPASAAVAPASDVTQISCSEINPALKQMVQKERLRLIQALRYLVPNCDWSDREFDMLLLELESIQQGDPYQIKSSPRKSKSHQQYEYFANRQAAQLAIPEIKFFKIASGLRSLPLEERITQLMQRIARQSVIDNVSFAAWFEEELVIVGPSAVPTILKKAVDFPVFRRTWVKVLGRIGEERAVDFIIESLLDRQSQHDLCRAEAAEALGKFRGEKVIEALIQGLGDDAYMEVDRCLTAQHVHGHVPCNAKYFLVQHKSANSLHQITGRDWGPLFREDQKTWRIWFETGQPDNFAPAGADRSKEEVDKLIEGLVWRNLSGRPNPCQPSNELDDAQLVRTMVADLKKVDPDIQRKIKAYCSILAAERPTWKNRLSEWVAKLESESNGSASP